MMSIRYLLLVCPAAGLLAQTPPPKPVEAPRPTVTLTRENPAVLPAPAVPPDRVVITVGDLKITAAQFDAIVDTLSEQVRAAARGPRRKEFADSIVNVMALAQEGRRQKLDVTPAFQAQTMWQSANLLANLVYTQMNKDAKVDDAAARQYFDQHKTELEQVHARHILIRFAGSSVPLKKDQKDLTEAEALAKVQALRQKIVDGADFNEVAKQESDDAGSAVSGGDLSFFGHGKMVPAFEQVAFALKPGDLSQPVKTQFGYHLIKVEAVKSFEDVRPAIDPKLRLQMAQKAVEDLAKKANSSLDPEFFGTAAK